MTREAINCQRENAVRSSRVSKEERLTQQAEVNINKNHLRI